MPTILFCERSNLTVSSTLILDRGIRIANCTSVVGDNVRHAPATESDLLHPEELPSRLLRCNPVDTKAALDVVKQAEVIFPWNQQDVCCQCGICRPP
jgi:hypothetical protein